MLTRAPRFGRTAAAAAALLWATATAPAAAPDPAAAFAGAEAAYTNNDFAGAARRYRELVAAGHAAPELFFNLGNACFKQNDLGQAVLNYRRGWMLAPRDPAIRANLRFAAEKAGAPAPEESLATGLLRRGRPGEWAAVAFAAYWLASALLGLSFFAGARAGRLRRAAVGVAVLMAVGLAGLAHTLALRANPELVVLAPGQRALFAPVEGSTPHFALPPGSVIRAAETSGPWVKVVSGKDAGWIHRSACAAVYPFTAGG